MTATPPEGTTTTANGVNFATTVPATAPAPVPTPPPVAAAPAAPAVPPTPPADHGFPANTPIAEMTIEQQAAYWKHHARQHENTVKARQDYDALKAKADEFDKFQAANATEHEKAVKAAADAARAEERQAATPRIVSAEFRAAAAGRIPAEHLATILEPLDMSKFLDAKGEVDTAKVAAFIEGVAPKPTAKKFPDMGQGRREGGAGPSVSAGRDLFEAQKKKTPASS